MGGAGARRVLARGGRPAGTPGTGAVVAALLGTCLRGSRMAGGPLSPAPAARRDRPLRRSGDVLVGRTHRRDGAALVLGSPRRGLPLERQFLRSPGRVRRHLCGRRGRIAGGAVGRARPRPTAGHVASRTPRADPRGTRAFGRALRGRTPSAVAADATTSQDERDLDEERRRDGRGWPSISAARASGSREAPTPPRPRSSSVPHTKRRRSPSARFATWRAGSTRRSSPPRARPGSLVARRARTGARRPLRAAPGAGAGRGRGRGLLRRLGGARERRTSLPRHADRGRRRTTGRLSRHRVRDDGKAARSPRPVRDSPVLGSASRLSAGVLVVDSPAGGPTM